MRALFVIVTVLAAAYAGYWFVGSRQIENRAADALAGLRERGWLVDFSSLDTTGFPSRFDTTVSGLRLSRQDGGLTWEAPFVQVLALSYRPNHVIAAFPPEQVVTVAGRPVTVTAHEAGNGEGLRASALAGLDRDLPLREAVVESGPLSVTATGGGVSADRLLAAVRAAGPGPNGYDLHLDLEDLRPFRGGPAPGGLDAVGFVGLRLEARVRLDRPLDRRLAGPPRLLGLRLDDLRLSRGDDFAVSASGDLAPDAQGRLEGEVLMVAENWRGILDVAEQAGVLGEGRRALVEGALEGLAEGGDRIEIPVTFADGKVSALGLPLLDAPRVLPAGG